MATRIRRGKEVEIPEQWVGKIPTSKTIRQRLSKLHGKLKRTMKLKIGGQNSRYKDKKDSLGLED